MRQTMQEVHARGGHDDRPRSRCRACRRDPEIGLARAAKRVGIGRELFVTTRCRVIREQASREHWCVSELAMSLADIMEAAQHVYGAEG